jgi:hypothetical protein
MTMTIRIRVRVSVPHDHVGDIENHIDDIDVYCTKLDKIVIDM